MFFQNAPFKSSTAKCKRQLNQVLMVHMVLPQGLQERAMTIATRFCLRISGVKVTTFAVLWGDNRAIQIGASILSSTLNKEHNAI